MIVLGAGRIGNSLFKRRSFEEKREKIVDRLEELAYESSKKFGTMREISDLQNYRSVKQNNTGFHIIDIKNEEFERWWHEKRLEIYANYYGEETARSIIKAEQG